MCDGECGLHDRRRLTGVDDLLLLSRNQPLRPYEDAFPRRAVGPVVAPQYPDVRGVEGLGPVSDRDRSAARVDGVLQVRVEIRERGRSGERRGVRFDDERGDLMQTPGTIRRELRT